MKLGMCGYGIFWAIVEMLRDEDGYAMPTDYESIAFALNEQSETIKSVIEDFGLFQISSNKFHSRSLHERMELMEAKSRNGKKAAKIRWDKEKDADALQPHSEGIAEVMQRKEKKGNEIKENLSTKENHIEIFRKLYQDQAWIEGLCMKFKCEISEARKHLIDFKDLTILNEEWKKDTSDAKKHFFYWINKVNPIPTSKPEKIILQSSRTALRNPE